jgi:hypothetical protein
MRGFIASGRRSPREWLPALILALLLASSAGADVVVREKTVSEGLGGFGNGTTSRTMIVAGDRSRSEDEVTYTGRFKTFAGGGKPRVSVTITRIDEEVIWNLDPDKKTYTEMTFAEMRELMAKGAAGMEKARAESAAKDAGTAKDAGMTFTVDVKRTGAKQEVNGFPAEQAIITCVGKPKDPPKDAQGGEIRMVMDLWLAKSLPGGPERADFARRFAEKLGLDLQLSGVSGTARAMYGDGMRELSAKMKDLGGTAVRSTFTIEGPPQSAGTQKQPADAAGGPEKQRADAKAAQEKDREAQAAADKRQDASDAANAGSSAVSRDKGGLGAGIGGFLGRKMSGAAQKKVEDKAEKQTEQMSSPGAGASGGGPLMKVVTDLVSISTSPAPAGSFDVPAGYKRQQKE